MSGRADLSIIIVNWNTRAHLAACLTAIEVAGLTVTNEVIVVDNASTDGSVDDFPNRWPQVRLIVNKTNEGFAAGVNDGLREAAGEYVLILNPDILLQRNSVETLIAYSRAHGEVGGLMPLLLDAHGNRQSGYTRRYPGIVQVILFHTFLEPWSRRVSCLVERFLEDRLPSGDEPVEVDQIPGAILLTRRDVVESVGFMDAAYKLFYEDVDWCCRMRNSGWKLVLVPSVVAIHAGGGSFRGSHRVHLHARMMVSLIRFLYLRRNRLTAAAAWIILVANSVFVASLRTFLILLFGPGSDDGEVFSRDRHLELLRLFYSVHLRRKDPGLAFGARVDHAISNLSP